MVFVSWVASSSRNCFLKPPSSSCIRRNPMEKHLLRTCWMHRMVPGFAQEAVSHHPLITYLLWTHRDVTDLGHVCPWCPLPSLFHHPLHGNLRFRECGLGTATLRGCFPWKAAGGRMPVGFGKPPLFAGAAQGVRSLIWEHLVLSSRRRWEVVMALGVIAAPLR